MPAFGAAEAIFGGWGCQRRHETFVLVGPDKPSPPTIRRDGALGQGVPAGRPERGLSVPRLQNGPTNAAADHAPR